MATIVGILAITASAASAEVIPSGGDFQATPPTWTAAGLSGNLNTVSASQASSGSNRFYRTQYTTPANLLGSSLLNMAATEGITSPTFTWNEGIPQSVTASFDSRAQLNGLLGVDANVGIGMYLQNQTTGTETLLASRRITQSSTDFSTVTATVSPSLLISGDSYRVQVRETFAPTVQLAGSSTVDLDNVDLTETPVTPPAPVVASGASITGVTSSGATANATIDPGSAATTVQVNYGTTTGYGFSTGSQTIPANSGPTPVSIPLSGLSPSTTYHAQVSATSSGGTTTSSDLTFTTPAASVSTPAPTVGTGSAQGAPGERSATVGTTINDAGAGSSYYVRYGTSTSYGSSTAPQTDPSGVSGSTPVTTALSGLTPNTTYHAEYVVSSSGGTTVGGDFTFTTAPLTPPTVGSASASTTSSDGTQETVSAVVDPGADDTQVAVSYGATSGYGSTTGSVLVPANSGSQTVSIPINGLTPGNTYHYTVTVTSADGSAGTADATFSPTAQTSPPIGQTSVSAGPGERSVTLASTINSGGNGGTYSVVYGTTTGYGSQTATQNLATTNGNQPLSASLTGLAPNTTYHAKFVADVNGYPASDGADFTFTTAPASPPTITSGPSAGTSDSAGDQETISATVDPGANDTQVSVRYGTSSSYGSTTAATTIAAGSGATSVSIPISGLSPGTQYHYSLTATNVDGTASSTDATFTPTASTGPAVGTTTATSGPDQTSVTLGASIDTGGSGGTYDVQYGTDTTYASQTTPQSLNATTGSQPLSTSLSGLTPGTTYHARFVVTVSGHPTSYGGDYTFTTNAPPSFTAGPTAATTSSDGTIETISATVDPGGQQTSVTVSYGTGSSYGSTSSTTTIAAGNGPQSVQIPISGLTPGASYHYAVIAANTAGTTSSGDQTFSPTAQTTPPVGATSTSGSPGEHSASLASTVDSGASGGTYYLQYGTSAGYGSQTSTQSLSATSGSQPLSASLSGLLPGTTYHAQFVVMVNGHPTSYGADFVFTTAAVSPPRLGSGGPTATTTSADGTQETISTTVDPGSSDTSVSVVYGTTGAYGSTASAPSVISAGRGATSVSITLGGLTPGVTYHYQVVAVNADGSTHTVDETFIPMATTTPPVSMPSTPQGPGTTSVTVDSTVDTGGNGGTWYVEYGTGSGWDSQTGPQPLSPTSGPQQLSAALSGLQPGTTYHVRFVVQVDGHPVAYGPAYTFTTARSATIVTSPGAACVAAYVTASARTLRMLSIPAGAQLTARHGLRISLQRRVRTTGVSWFQVSGGPRTRIRGRAFTITRGQLRAGHASTVRVVIPQRRRRTSVTLRIGTSGCGVQLGSVGSRRSLLLTLRLPLGARRIVLTLPRGASSPAAITLTTPAGSRTLALAGRGTRLHLRRRAGALRVTARGSSITVTGLGRTTTGVSLRFATWRVKGRVTATVRQLSGGSASARLAVGARR